MGDRRSKSLLRPRTLFHPSNSPRCGRRGDRIAKLYLLQLLTAVHGTKRTNRLPLSLSAFGGIADMAGHTAMSAFDPKRTSAESRCILWYDLCRLFQRFQTRSNEQWHLLDLTWWFGWQRHRRCDGRGCLQRDRSLGAVGAILSHPGNRSRTTFRNRSGKSPSKK